MITMDQLRNVLASRGGVLKRGSHDQCVDSCCAMECLSIALDQEPNDQPLGWNDRTKWTIAMNDTNWPTDQDRTEALLPTLLLPDPDPKWIERVHESYVAVLLPKFLNVRGFGHLVDKDVFTIYDKIRELSGVKPIYVMSNLLYPSPTGLALAVREMYMATGDGDYLKLGVQLAIERWTK